MLNLLIKDLFIQKKTIPFTLFYIVFLIFFFQKPPMSTTVYVMSTVTTVYLFTIYASGHDDKNRSEVLLNSLPVSRREIVLAKYLSTLLYAAIVLVGTTLFMAVLDAAGLKFLTRLPGFQDVAGSLAGAIVLGSFYHPLCFRFGVMKMRYFNLGLFMLLFFFPGFLIEFLKAHYSREAIVSPAAAILNTPGWLQGSAVAVLLLGLLLASLALSLKIYENKEF